MRRWPLKTLLVVLAATLAVYGLVLQVWGGGARAPLALLWSWTGLGMAALCFVNFVLRGLRWRMWMAQHGRQFSLPVALRLYWAGFTFTPTPGNVGEVLRGVMLAREPLTMAQSLSIFSAERVADLLCLLLLCVPALGWVSHSAGLEISAWGIAVATSLLGLACLLAWRLAHTVGRPLITRLLKRFNWLAHAWACLTLRPVTWFTLTLGAWVAQGVAVWLVCRELGLNLSWLFATSTYALAMVAGALSTLPAGLGSMEASQVALLTMQGAAASLAIAITAITRILTLWLAVATGMIALFYSVAVSKDIRLS